MNQNNTSLSLPKPKNKGRSKPSRITHEAIQVLEQISTLSKSDLQTCLYSARLISPSEEIFTQIKTYARRGQVHGYHLKVRNIVRLIRNGQKDLEHHPDFKKKFRMLLWHGTREDVVGQIIKNGFILPQNNGQMFGPGIYFADRISKSVNYCPPGKVPIYKPNKGFVAYMLLCDVAIGKPYNAKNAHNEFTTQPSGYKHNFGSVMCTGSKIPDRKGQIKLPCKSFLPLGKTIPNDKFTNYNVQFNEYIIYDTDRVRIRYLVEVEVM